MNSATIFQVYRAALWERRSQGPLWVYAILLGMTLGLPVLPFVFHIRLAFEVSMFIIAGLIFAFLCSFLNQMVCNSLRLVVPHYAQIVPGLRKSVYAAYVLAFLLGSVTLAGLCALAVGHFWIWFWALGAILLVFTVVMTPGNLPLLLGLIGFVLVFDTQWLRGWITRSGLLSGEVVPTMMANGLLLALLVGLLRFTLGVRGERAYRLLQKLKSREQVMRFNVSKESTAFWGRWLGSAWLYEYSLKRALATGVAGPALFRFGLGYSFHWSVNVSNLVLVVLQSTLMAYPIIFGVHNSSGGAYFLSLMLCLNLLFLPITVVQQGFQALWHYRHEQALLKLLPGSPSGRGLNRWVALALLRQFGGTVALGLLFFVLEYLVLQGMHLAPLDVGMGYLPCALVALPPLCLTPLGIYAKMRQRAIYGWPFYLVSGALFGGLAIQNSFVNAPATFWKVAGITLLLSALLFVWRWRQTLAAPVAFPAGRNSGF